MPTDLFRGGGNGRLGTGEGVPVYCSHRSNRSSAGDRIQAHGKENPPTFYAAGPPDSIRALSPRQLPTDHDCAVPTRGYQSDQPSFSPHLSPALLLLYTNKLATKEKTARWYVKVLTGRSISEGQALFLFEHPLAPGFRTVAHASETETRDFQTGGSKVDVLHRLMPRYHARMRDGRGAV